MTQKSRALAQKGRTPLTNVGVRFLHD